MNKSVIFTLLLMLSATTAKAEKINLVADDRVEWHQSEQKMVAVGNAVASKKDMSIRADTITAYYENSNEATSQTKKSQIKTVHAKGGVILKSARADGFGNTMDYDVAADTMVLKGSPAKIKTAQEEITTTGSITYYPSKQQAIALENVVAIDAQKNKVHSDKMVSFFEKNAQGNLEMQRVEIYDNVKIITKDAEVTADRGVYLPKENLVNLYENVVIKQNGNFIRGDVAVTDLNTGISRLQTKKGSGKRVSGVFKEKEKNTTKEKAPKQEETSPQINEPSKSDPVKESIDNKDAKKTWQLKTL